MKVQVRLDMEGHRYLVEKKESIFTRWRTVDYVYIDHEKPEVAAEYAIAVAKRVLNPVIIYSEKN